MKAAVIREMSSTEIRERIDNEKTAYQKLKMNHVVSSLENPIKLKYARKAIARLSTELTNRERNETEGSTSTAAPAKAEQPVDTSPEEEIKETEDTVAVEETDEDAQAK